MRPFWLDWEYWLIVFTWIPWVTFTAVYWQSAPRWLMTAIGRGVMAPALSMLTLLSFGLVQRMFDLPPVVLAGIRVCMFASVIVAGWLLLFALLKELRRARTEGCPRRRATDHVTEENL